MSETPVVTRFAPSPTGFLHIGGARTALFNWLFARGCQGSFFLRIEDTDRARSTKSAIDAIIEGLGWLGLDWDGEPFFQSHHADDHRDVAHRLLEAGAAYKCYGTAEDIEQWRGEARAEGRALRSPWRDRLPETAPAGQSFVVRLRVPETRSTEIEDIVQGKVSWKNKDFDDFILLRSDGSPTYMLAVVADDRAMGVTHVIRGDDHLVNAGRQSLIYDALGWKRPVFVHIPLIYGPDGKKLSKRHGALGVEVYRDQGFLPEALCNYLLRLGWARGDQEYFSREEAIQAFSPDGLNKAPARLDFDKMKSVNAHYMRLAEEERLLKLLAPFLESGFKGSVLPKNQQKLMRAMPVLKTRAQTLHDLAEQARFLMRPLPYDLSPKVEKKLTEEMRERLLRLKKKMEESGDWSEPALDAMLTSFLKEENVLLKEVGPVLRGLLTGGAPSPGLSDTLYSLGREESLARMQAFLLSSPKHQARG